MSLVTVRVLSTGSAPGRERAADRGEYRQAAGAVEKALIWGSSVIVITEQTGVSGPN